MSSWILLEQRAKVLIIITGGSSLLCLTLPGCCSCGWKHREKGKEKQEHARNPILPLSESSERSSAAFVVSDIGMKDRPELSSYLCLLHWSVNIVQLSLRSKLWSDHRGRLQWDMWCHNDQIVVERFSPPESWARSCRRGSSYKCCIRKGVKNQKWKSSVRLTERVEPIPSPLSVSVSWFLFDKLYVIRMLRRFCTGCFFDPLQLICARYMGSTMKLSPPPFAPIDQMAF